MERRKILLGSGAVFATVLAGCSDSTSEDDGGGGDTGGSGTDGGDDDDSYDNDNNDDTDDIPGFDKDKVKLDRTDVKVDDIKRDGYHVDVEVTLEKTPKEDELHEIAEEFSVIAADGVKDPEKLANSVETVEFVIYNKDGDVVFAFYLDVAWIVAYVRNEMSEEELIHKAKSTA